MNLRRALCALSLAGLLVAPLAQAADRPAQANYLLRCSGCHGPDGSGAPAAGIPPLPGFISAFTADEQGRTYLMHVPGVVSTGLNDREIAAVMNYVVDRWGNARQPFTRFTPEEVTHLRAIEVADVVAYRRDLIKRLQAEGQPVAAYPWP